MKKTIKLVSILLLVMMVVVSCSPEKTMDGKTAATKKQMTSTEYSENRQAIRSVTVVEAYAVANPELAESATRALSGEQVLKFKEETEVSTSVIVEKLKALESTEGATEAEKAFYTSLAASLPADFKVSVMSDSFVKYNIDKTGVKTITSLDITIKVGDKTIEIEKDADDKWIEIDGTFFDDTELEKMLDAAEDAAESIEKFFTNLKMGWETLENIAKGTIQKIKEGNFGEEAKATGSYSFTFEDNVFVANFDYEYFEVGEEEEKIKVEGIISFNFESLDDAFKALFGLDEDKFEEFIKSAKDTIDVKISVNGMEVWADAFLDELD